MKPYLLVFVCTGNICRSPMAEGVMKQVVYSKAQRTGSPVPIRVISAGTHAMNGTPASEHAVYVTAEDGIDISGHSSQLLDDKIVTSADLILTMERRHTSLVTYNWPLVSGISELITFKNTDTSVTHNLDIMDPIGGSIPIYREVYDQIKYEVLRVASGIIDRAYAKRI